MIKIVTIVGARPQFIKAAAVSRAIRTSFADAVTEHIVHTGQHFDDNMSQVFFDELQIPPPKHHLAISGGNHGSMTGKMLEAIEAVLISEKPDWVLIYGDTNSTLAGALAAAKLHIPVAHVEAGLRSFNMRMPEEVNRVLSDRVSRLLFCPTSTAVNNLAREGISEGVFNVGDVMYDVALFHRDKARSESRLLNKLNLAPKTFALATCHRAENTDEKIRLQGILKALNETATSMPVVFPLHPRTKKKISDFNLEHLLVNLIMTEPLSFLDMVALEQEAAIIFTDSGGVQKEAFFYGVPCVTMRRETEWTETLSLGWNKLADHTTEHILRSASEFQLSPPPPPTSLPYGTGNSATCIVQKILASPLNG